MSTFPPKDSDPLPYYTKVPYWTHFAERERELNNQTEDPSIRAVVNETLEQMQEPPKESIPEGCFYPTMPREKVIRTLLRAMLRKRCVQIERTNGTFMSNLPVMSLYRECVCFSPGKANIDVEYDEINAVTAVYK